VSRWPAAALAVAAALAPAFSTAHPHVFVDAAARFLLDAEGRLEAVRVTHLYDPLVSIFVLQDLGYDPFAPLTGPEADRLAAEQRALLEASSGFAALSVGAREADLGPVGAVDAALEDGRMRVDFTLPLTTPEPMAGREAVLAVYDPVYFIAFELTGEVSVEGGGDCVAEALEWEPSPSLLTLQDALSGLPPDETPEDPTVGRLFASEARLTCR
jgi:ABC-type uncharacterized transport system substrate-binding protein